MDQKFLPNKMKTLLPPTLAVVLSTALCVWFSRASGMPSGDLKIVAVVAGSVSALAAFGAVALAAAKPKRPARAAVK